MSTKINKAVALRVIEEFESHGNLAVANELLAPNYRLHVPGSKPLDQKGHERLLSLFHTAFPDMQITVLFQIAEGDRVANHVALRGTHRKEFQGIAATGKSVLITGNSILHFENGKITEFFSFMDSVGLLQQLGVMPVDLHPEQKRQTSSQTGGLMAKPAELVYRFVEHFNNKEAQMIGRDFADDYELDFPGGPSGYGPDGIRQAAESFITAFPDIWFRIDDLFSEDKRAAWRWGMTGTQRGKFGSIPPSGKMVTFSGISLFRIGNGKIVEDKVRADVIGLLQQIGAMPAADRIGASL